jgi:PAS domain-containing protein
VGIFLTDAEGDYLFVNKRWCEIAESGACAEHMIRERLQLADPATLDALGIVLDQDGEFLIPVRTLLAVGQKRP